MTNKETLLNLIQNTQLSKKELSRKLYKYLCSKFDSTIVKNLSDQLMQLNIPEEISEEKIIELIKLLDENATTQSIETVKVATPQQIEENNVIQDAYNTMYSENETLRKTLKQKDEAIHKLEKQNTELETQNKQIVNRLDKLESFLERFKKYNVTEFNELIELEDDTINKLYVNYLQDGSNKLENGYIFEIDDTLIIPKSYYKVEKEND